MTWTCNHQLSSSLTPPLPLGAAHIWCKWCSTENPNYTTRIKICGKYLVGSKASDIIKQFIIMFVEMKVQIQNFQIFPNIIILQFSISIIMGWETLIGEYQQYINHNMISISKVSSGKTMQWSIQLYGLRVLINGFY